MSTSDSAERYGQIAYEAYGDSVGWKVFSGADMPQWGETQERIREAWRAAGQAVADATQAEMSTAQPVRTEEEVRPTALRGRDRWR